MDISLSHRGDPRGFLDLYVFPLPHRRWFEVLYRIGGRLLLIYSELCKLAHAPNPIKLETE
jgi:hypothetical protein